MIKSRFHLLNERNKNFFIYGIGQAFNLLSPLIAAPIIVSVCGDDGFGKVGLGFSMSLFLILIVDYAFDVKATKQIAENRNDLTALESILCTTIFTKTLLFLIVLMVAVPMLLFLPFLRTESTLCLLSLMIVFAQVFNPVWFLQGIENFKSVSVLNVLSKTLYIVLIITCINQKADYIYVNFFLGFSTFIFNISFLIYIIFRYKLKIKTPDFITVANILKKDFTFCMSQLLLSARQLSPFTLTFYLLNASIAGQYRIIEQVITLVRTFLQVYLKFFFPSACYKFLTAKTEGFWFWKKYSVIGNVFIFTLLSVIFVFSTAILRYFHLSAETVLAINPIFRLSLIVSLLMSVSLPLEQLMLITERHRNYIKVVLLVTIVNIALIFALIPYFRLYGIITALLVSEFLFIGFYYKFAFLHLRKTILNESTDPV